MTGELTGTVDRPDLRSGKGRRCRNGYRRVVAAAGWPAGGVAEAVDDVGGAGSRAALASAACGASSCSGRPPPSLRRCARAGLRAAIGCTSSAAIWTGWRGSSRAALAPTRPRTRAPRPPRRPSRRPPCPRGQPRRGPRARPRRLDRPRPVRLPRLDPLPAPGRPRRGDRRARPRRCRLGRRPRAAPRSSAARIRPPRSLTPRRHAGS